MCLNHGFRREEVITVTHSNKPGSIIWAWTWYRAFRATQQASSPLSQLHISNQRLIIFGTCDHNIVNRCRCVKLCDICQFPLQVTKSSVSLFIGLLCVAPSLIFIIVKSSDYQFSQLLVHVFQLIVWTQICFFFSWHVSLFIMLWR